jgi:hypothetical protein
MSSFKILHAQVDDSEDDGCIRILVNGLIKYIFVDPGTFPISHTTPRSRLAVELPPIPPGNWTTIRLIRNASDGALSFHSAESATLPAIEKLWHPMQIDYLDLTATRSFTYNVYEVTVRDNLSPTPKLPSFMIAKFARYPRCLDQYTRENEIYAKLKDLNIAPRFLGYITEDNGMGSRRPIGYLLEKLEGRHATSLSDFPLCRATLEKFHKATGCVHGDPNCYNFMIKPDGSAALVFDFERSEERNEDRMRREIDNFEANMKEDEDAKQDMGEVKWREHCLQEQLEVAAPMSEEDELRLDEMGEDEWVAEKVRERLRGELPD